MRPNKVFPERTWCLTWMVVAVLGVLLAGTDWVRLHAAATPDENTFNAAAQSFKMELYDRAEKELGEFARLFPQSERVPEVILLQAQARFKQKQYEPAIQLLQTNYAKAGRIADQYRYWIAESYFYQSNYIAAATNFALLNQVFTNSLQLSAASYGEALAWFKQDNLTNTLERLQRPDGPFQKAAQTATNDPPVLRGFLLLSETQMNLGHPKQAEETLQSVANRSFTPELDWQRQHLLVRIKLADGRAAEAVTNLTNLVTAAVNTGVNANKAEAALLQGRVWEDLGQITNAIQVYEQSLAALPLPESQRRQIMLKLAALQLNQTNTALAITSLDRFVSQFPKDPDLDLIRLTLGELWLKQYHALAVTNRSAVLAAPTNVLTHAQTNFSLLITQFPKSPLLGQAHYHRAWILRERGQLTESLAAFQEAVAKLPAASTNQLLARLEWADVQFQLQHYTNALVNYTNVVEQGAALPKALLERALYQWEQTCIELANPDGATNALHRLFALNPKSEFGDRALMRLGQWFRRVGQPAAAREQFAALVRQFPQSPLAPHAQDAIARALAQEAKWDEALRQYDEWIRLYTNHAELYRVEFERAWAYDQAGQETDAFNIFTNYIARYPKSPLAPKAQFWVGNFYFNQGKFVKAEESYQLVYQNTNVPPSELTYQAKLAAGRAAYVRPDYRNATNHFTELLLLPAASNANRTALILAQAWMALGDTFTTMAASDAANAKQNYAEAINAFSKVQEIDPSLAPRAWGRIANCHFQLASENPERFKLALQFYQQVITNPSTDVETRSNAEVGLAIAYEKQAQGKPPAEKEALLKQALEHYLNVVTLKNLRPNEKPHAFWLAKAGQEAGRLLESRNEWIQAAKLYQQLLDQLPTSISATVQKRLDQARKRL